MKFIVNSNKLGSHTVEMDDEDYIRLTSEGWTFYLWSTERHYGIYVCAYSSEDRVHPKRLHRIIMNAAPGQIVDHINRNPLDNRRENLRLVSSTINNQNARKRKDGRTSSYKGVHFCKLRSMWVAQIQVNGKKKSLGGFKTEIEAAKAYDCALLTFDIKSPRNIGT